MTDEEAEDLQFPPVEYFREWLLRDATDLMTRPISEDIFGGRLESVGESARGFLAGHASDDVHKMLEFGDLILSVYIAQGQQFTNQHGQTRSLRIDDLECIRQTDLLSAVARACDAELVILDDNDIETSRVEISPVKFCAAFALSQVLCAARFCHDDWLATNGGFHAMMAAEALAIARLLSGADPFSAAVLEKRVLTDRAKQGAIARLSRDSDGKQAAKREAHQLWLDWQQGRTRHSSAAAFERYVISRLPIESQKTVERWRKEWAAGAGQP